MYVLSQYCCKTNFVEKYGQWAVISGATDGIGQAMARELAQRGMSILVVARNEEKLAATKAMLEQVPNVGQVETVKIDLADPSAENFARARAQIDPDNRDIGLLINNAGSFPDRYARYNRFDMSEIASLVNLNVLATLHLTRMIMPGMLTRCKGMVVNVSSVLGSTPAPFFNVYGCTKSFVDSFTRQLQMEYKSHPIDIVLLQPGQVATKLLRATSKMSRSSFMIPTPEAYAKSSLNALSTGISSFTGCVVHAWTLLQLQLFYSAGLLAPIMELMARVNGKSAQFSPVMKRKRVVEVPSPENVRFDGDTSNESPSTTSEKRDGH